jgi:hypothetical protein
LLSDIDKSIKEIFLGNKKPATSAGSSYNVADSEGFEPPVGLTLRLISSQVH